MDSEGVAAAVILTALQLPVLRAAQSVVPSFYFTTSSLFDRREHVAGGAILFRLSVPFVAGALAAALTDENEIQIAIVSGFVAWFLIVWPIVWSPALVPHPLHLPFLSVLGGFWVAFTLLPAAGAATVDLIGEVASGTAPEWQAQYVWAILTLPVGVTITALGRFAGAKLSFVNDQVDDSPDDSEGERSWSRRLADLRYARTPEWVWPAALILLLLYRRRER